MNEQQLQALAAAHGGIAGRTLDPKTTSRPLTINGIVVEGRSEPNPDPHWIITFGDGSQFRVQPQRDAQGQPSGEYAVADWGNLAPTRPTGNEPPKGDIWNDPKTGRPYQVIEAADGSKHLVPVEGTPSQVPIPLGNGGYVVNPATGAMEYLPPQPTPQGIGYQPMGNTVLQTLPDGTVRPVFVDQAAIARQQAELEDARTRTALQGQQVYQQGQQQQGQQAYQNAQLEQQSFNNYWNNVIAASQADESAQQNAFTRDYRLLYELPRTQVADENQARLNQYQAAASQGTYETGRFNAGQNAADARVRQLMETLPYRASPQFAQQFATRRAQEAQRQPLTPYTADAFTFRAPDFEGARRAGYAEAGVQPGGLPSFEALLQRTPAFATMSPEELKRLQMQMSFAYAPPPPVKTALAGG